MRAIVSVWVWSSGLEDESNSECVGVGVVEWFRG